jgi:O-antigen/teichoic acid export membrane protein
LEDISVDKWLWTESKLVSHVLINVVIALILWKSCKYWLGIIMPKAMLQEVENHSGAVIGLLLVATASGAFYMGTALINGLGHVNVAFRISLVSNIVILGSLLFGWLISLPFDAMIVISASGLLLENIFSYAYCTYKNKALIRHSRLGPTNDVDYSKRSLSVSLMFFYLQALSLVANNIDSMFLSSSATLHDIGIYSVIFKLFSFPILIMSVVNAHYWPKLAANGRISGSDGGKMVLSRLLYMNFSISVLFSVTLLFTIKPIYQLLVGKPLDHVYLPWLISAFVVMMSIRGPLTTYMNAAELIVFNVVGNTVFTIAAVFLKISLVRSYSIEGIALANIIGYSLFLFPFHLIGQRHHRKSLFKKSNIYESAVL